MFIKVGDGVITDIVKSPSELTDEQKRKAEEIAKTLSPDSKDKENGDGDS